MSSAHVFAIAAMSCTTLFGGDTQYPNNKGHCQKGTHPVTVESTRETGYNIGIVSDKQSVKETTTYCKPNRPVSGPSGRGTAAPAR
jgi:hypothetical protein